MADKPKHIAKSQHIVPRCYLRGFAGEQQRLYNYNKANTHTSRR
jgi:hypothetical protein